MSVPFNRFGSNLGSLVYHKNDGEWMLESTGFSGGRIIASAGAGEEATYTPLYHITDHLGSVRSVFTYNNNTPELIAQNDYYAFGLKHSNPQLAIGSETENRFLYNGKELQAIGSLNLLDYGARMYNAELGRWDGVDLLAEKYYSTTPYAFTGNNPVVFIDTDGMSFTYNWSTGSYQDGGGNTVSWDVVENHISNDPTNYVETSSQNYNEINSFMNAFSTTTSVMTTGMQYSKPFVYLAASSATASGYQFRAINLSRVGKIAGLGSFFLFSVADVYGIYNYYNDPSAIFTVSPQKGAANFGLGALGVFAPEVGLPYLMLESFYPGGLQGYSNDVMGIEKQRGTIFGDRYNYFKMLEGTGSNGLLR